MNLTHKKENKCFGRYAYFVFLPQRFCQLCLIFILHLWQIWSKFPHFPTTTLPYVKCCTKWHSNSTLIGFSDRCLLSVFVCQAPAGGPQAEQDGTGNWRGMLKKGEEAAGSGPGSPLKGVVNLLDVVSKPVCQHQPLLIQTGLMELLQLSCLALVPLSLSRLPGSCRHGSRGTARSSSASSSRTSSSSGRTSRTGKSAGFIHQTFASGHETCRFAPQILMTYLKIC